MRTKSALIQTFEKLDFQSQLVQTLGEGSAKELLGMCNVYESYSCACRHNIRVMCSVAAGPDAQGRGPPRSCLEIYVYASLAAH